MPQPCLKGSKLSIVLEILRIFYRIPYNNIPIKSILVYYNNIFFMSILLYKVQFIFLNFIYAWVELLSLEKFIFFLSPHRFITTAGGGGAVFHRHHCWRDDWFPVLFLEKITHHTPTKHFLSTYFLRNCMLKICIA